VLGLIGFLAGYTLEPGPLEDFPRIMNPYGVDSLILEAVAVAGAILASASMVASAVSLIVRMRRAGTVERQQIKWLAYAAVPFGIIISIDVFGYEDLFSRTLSTLHVAVGFSRTLSTLLVALGFAGLYIAVGVAILKHRLYDIDLVINRTLVYGTLTAMLALVYFGGVAMTEAILRALTGQEQQPQLAVVVSTLVIAALFNPLRWRLQGFIDRRFYRRKYDARKTLEALSAKLRDETDLDALNAALVGVIRETMQPAHVSLWLRPDTPPKEDEQAH
jgi:hypothetical protein